MIPEAMMAGSIVAASLLGYMLTCIAVGVAAKLDKNRLMAGYMILAFLITPFFAAIVLLCTPRRRSKDEENYKAIAEYLMKQVEMPSGREVTWHPQVVAGGRREPTIGDDA